MSGDQTPAIPDGYVGLADAPRRVASIRPADRQRARVLVERALRAGLVEVVELIDGEAVLVGAGELASAALDFSAGRIRRAGIKPASAAGAVPVRLLWGGDLAYLNHSTAKAPEGEPEAPPAPRSGASPGAFGGSPSAGPPIMHGDGTIDLQATLARDRRAEMGGRAPPSGRAEFAGLSEEFHRARMERAAGSVDYQPATAARAVPVAEHGPEWGPLILLLIEDLDRALAPNASRPQPQRPPAVETGGGADEGPKRGRPLAYDATGIKIFMKRWAIQNGMPASKQILSTLLTTIYAQPFPILQQW